MALNDGSAVEAGPSGWERRRIPNTPTGEELALFFGNRESFQVGAPRVMRGRVRPDGWIWVGVHFDQISRGDVRWTAPSADFHVTLMWGKFAKLSGPKLAALDHRIAELQKRMPKVKPAALVAVGVARPKMGFKDYMWVDFLHVSRLHQTLCCWASHLNHDFKKNVDFLQRPSFHMSFASATERVTV